MTEKQIQRELARLPERIQVAFLTACVEHVSSVCGDDQTVRKAIELGWAFAVESVTDERAVGEIVSSLDASLDEDSPSELVYLAAAAELVVTSLKSPNKAVAQVLNNVEAAVDVVDPEPELGMKEERRWQEQALEVAKNLGDRQLARGVFTALYAQETDWMKRFLTD